MAEVFRQSVFGRLGGYEDLNDAVRLGRERCAFLTENRAVGGPGKTMFDGQGSIGGSFRIPDCRKEPK